MIEHAEFNHDETKHIVPSAYCPSHFHGLRSSIRLLPEASEGGQRYHLHCMGS